MNPTDTTLAELVGWACATWADELAVVDGETRIGYAELGQRVERTARALAASGARSGDRVAVWAPNCWPWVVVALAVMRAGCVLVPVNTRFKGEEAADVLGRSRASFLFAVTDFLGGDHVAMLDGHDLPDLDEIVVVSGPTPTTTTAPATSWASFDERASAVEGSEIERRSGAVGADDIGAIMFTSGTTGLPKGVMVRGSAMIRAFHGWGQALGVSRGDRYLLVNPYFHAFGLNAGIVVCLLGGATNVAVAVFDPGEVLSTIERERITVFTGPPALFQQLLNHPALDDHDLSSLRSCVTGAATIPVEMVVAMRERLGFDVVITAYGMTETSGIATHTRAGDPPEVVATTSGRAIPDVEVRIADADGHEAPRGANGEIQVRGYQIMAGYLDDPDATAAAVDAEGWLHTGDIGVMDDAGYIDITDRLKDMFIVGGFNASPAEIERKLIEHPDVGQVAVIGIPDDRLGEVGGAFVVPAAGAAPRSDEVIAWARDRMANYKVPRHVWTVEALPLNASNKVRKDVLRARAAELLAVP